MREATIKEALGTLKHGTFADFLGIGPGHFEHDGNMLQITEATAREVSAALIDQMQETHGPRFTETLFEGYRLLQLQAAVATLLEGPFCSRCGYPFTPNVMVAPCSICGSFLCDDCIDEHGHGIEWDEDSTDGEEEK